MGSLDIQRKGLGSGIAGGSTSGSMLIAGRTIQGFGSGGTMLLIEMIVCENEESTSGSSCRHQPLALSLAP
jgi:MFS family permease